MAVSKEAELNNLVEDQETFQFLLDDLRENNPSDTKGIAEMHATIKRIEAQIAQLLGTAPNGNSTVNSVNPSSLPNGDMAQLSTGPAAFEQGASVPATHADPTSTPYHPSTAPSPFVNRASNAAAPSLHTGTEESRKRQRQGSSGSPVQQQSSKRVAIDRLKSRYEKLEADLERELNRARHEYEESKEADAVQTRAMAEEISVAQVLEKLEKEQEEEEEAIRAQFRTAMDEQVARMIHAEDLAAESDEERRVSPSSQFRLPDRTLPHHQRPPTSPSLFSSRHSGPYAVPTQFDYNPEPPGSYPYEDDDLQEIPREYFDSRFPDSRGYNPFGFNSSRLTPPGRYSNGNSSASLGPRFGPPRYSPMFNSLGGRNLPWMQGEIPSHSPILEAVDLLRDNPLGLEDEDDLERYEEQNFPEDIKNLITGIKDIREATKVEKDETPAGLKVTLMKHQKIGVSWMKAKEESNHKGGILADDMGLGKTIQAIALMVARPPPESERQPTLIVAPKALMEQWRREIQRHILPGKHQLSVFIYHGTNRAGWNKLKTYDVVITTFGTLTASYKFIIKAEKMEEEGKDSSLIRDTRNMSVFFTPSTKFHRVIVDEAQNIKNPAAKSARACCRLNATYRWCLTGTPMMNRLEDFQSLLSFLRIRPYNNKEKFRRDFRVVKSGFVPEHVMQQLRILVKSVCFRRTKTSKIDGEPILQLPPKVIEKVHVVFDEKEREFYDALSSKSQKHVERLLNAGILGKKYSTILVLLLRLRQACCHTQLLQEHATEIPAMEGRDMIANAKALSPTVVERIKGNEGGEDDGTCPICMDIVENAVIYIPCGHSVCNECFARISDPQMLARNDNTAGMIKCQNCRGPVDPLKITDGESFKKVYSPSEATESETTDRAEEESEESDLEDSDSDTDSDGSSDKPKKKSLAELRKEGQKNKRAKRRYLRRLEKSWEPSAKILKALEILEENEARGKGEKTIVFSQFTSLLDLLEVPLNRKGQKYCRFDGSMNITQRNEAVATFTDDPEVRIMLVSLKAGNAGLNLVAASHVIIFDPFWNPYVEDQAIDRAHRIGQARDVFVHRLLIENTVEDRIIDLQEKKRELISGALDEGGSMNVSRLDVKELAYLFGVRT
ncbi:Uncharacterized protein PECH_006006 [Penicillium ucsense]|uniref:RING-type domain-containing protein n=1 Tax=Penicillium ucsense TaxID=2839758 RepID=A0A8J8W3V8_9EURO|nr:Uncharacterized protein PECM_006497 [Penicillium ucsense]KAF7735968.1 Uncharacterized protein PECH_006006 [Penicillium ucsense]